MKLPAVGRVREVWREQGVRGIWFRTWDVLGYRRLIILRRPLDAPITNHIATVPVSVDWLTPAQLPELLAERGSADATELQARWQRGHRCLAARVEGRLVATMWAATGP
ncbi:MAG: hypothetical protein N3A53_06710, partial [Verrucomicrobiae bacterium]|nr:hypothetical protein [Verrucomicrobiae bacterium]